MRNTFDQRSPKRNRRARKPNLQNLNSPAVHTASSLFTKVEFKQNLR